MKERIAIVGSGVSGLGCAWRLRDLADITIFEKDHRPGGHTNTVTVQEGSAEVPIDTGFIVFNHVTYPNLVQLFSELGVSTKASEMSFSVSHRLEDWEYNGMGLNKLFAQRANLLRPRFHAFVWQVMRFFRVARESLQDPSIMKLTLREFVKKHHLGDDFLNFYLVPMSSAVWSTESDRVLDFPAISLLRFFENHGFLGVTTHHPWFTVSGGAKSYVDAILKAVRPVRLPCPVTGVRDTGSEAIVRTADGTSINFDRVIIAAHADQALAMLESPTESQSRLLSAFSYQKNRAILHTDPTVMPTRRLAWAAWNYRIAADPAGPVRATTHYWMNALQGVSQTRDYFVSLNSDIAPEHVLYETAYEHPVFTLAAMRAQQLLPALNTVSPQQRIFFCGSYFRYGFHEDAYASAVQLTEILSRHLNR